MQSERTKEKYLENFKIFSGKYIIWDIQTSWEKNIEINLKETGVIIMNWIEINGVTFERSIESLGLKSNLVVLACKERMVYDGNTVVEKH